MIKHKRLAHGTYLDADLPNKISLLVVCMNTERALEGLPKMSIVDHEQEAWRDYLAKHQKTVDKFKNK